MSFNPPNYWGRRFFFDVESCQRCGRPLDARIMSWFNDQAICMDCSAKEDELKQKMRQRGMNPDDYEGCGYIPSV